MTCGMYCPMLPMRHLAYVFTQNGRHFLFHPWQDNDDSINSPLPNIDFLNDEQSPKCYCFHWFYSALSINKSFQVCEKFGRVEIVWPIFNTHMSMIFEDWVDLRTCSHVPITRLILDELCFLFDSHWSTSSEG